jgi:hypothetical protein
MKRKEVSIAPELNTVVVFSTDDTSFHGHPDPLVCPGGITRDSIALYYYSPAKATDQTRDQREATDYRARGITDTEVILSSAKSKLIDRLKRR